MQARQISAIRKIYTDKNCAYCGWMKAAVSWWCSCEAAVKARRTSIPGVCHCTYWKPDKDYIIKELATMSEPVKNPAQINEMYGIYGVPVIDPTKQFILTVDIPEGKKPWYKRLWQYIKRIFNRLRAQSK